MASWTLVKLVQRLQSWPWKLKNHWSQYCTLNNCFFLGIFPGGQRRRHHHPTRVHLQETRPLQDPLHHTTWWALVTNVGTTPPNNSDQITRILEWGILPLRGLQSWYPIILVKSLQLIWRLGTRRFHRRVPNLQKSCCDLTKWANVS